VATDSRNILYIVIRL